MRYQLVSRAPGLALAVAFALIPLHATAQTTPAPSIQIPGSASAAAAAETVRRVSLDDVVKLALEQNLGIQIQRIDPQIQDVGIAQAKSLWAPNFTTTVARNSTDQPVTSIFSGGQTSVVNGQLSSGVGLNEQLPWGGAYSAGWNSARLTTTNVFNNFSPQLQSQLLLNYTQPLLRNRSVDLIRQQVQISKKVRDLSDIQLRAVIVSTERAAKNAYWDLVYAINNLAAQRQSLDLAQQSLQDNEKRVQIGTMAPIDIVQAQAEVAANQQNVIVADAAIKRAEDQLRALIFDPGATDFWTMNIEPTDTAAFQTTPIDTAAAIRNALDKRTDLMQAKNSIEQSDVNIRYFRNQLMPQVDAQVNYGTVGIGGTELAPVDLAAIGAGAPIGTRTIVSQRGFSNVLGDVIQSAYPQWTVGVQIGYPLGMSTQQTNLARARLQYQQAQTQVKNIELQIVTQVRDAARQVQTNQQRVASAKASRELQEKKLEAEEKKFSAGMSTSFFVFQAQRDLAQARTLEIQAIADYNKSLVDFDAVQEISLTGPVGGVTTAGAGAIITTPSPIIRSGGN